MQPIITASQLTKTFDKLTAVDNISFQINKGECFGFLGPNGAGKTSTMRMIYCASPKTSGELAVKDMDANKDQRKIKSIVGVVPQENNLDPDFTVYKNLLVYARYHSIPNPIARKRADELLEFIQLQKKRDTIIEHLSAGMKRRLIIARALLNNPEILILDEPTTGLDPQARHLIWDRLRELKGKGITIVLTTHYMEEAAKLCDRLVIMDYGKILVEGKPDELIKKYIGRKVLEIAPKTEQIVEFLRNRGLSEIEEVGNRIYAFTDDCDALLDELSKRFELHEKIVRMATLEDVFLKLTGRGLRE